MGTNKGKSIARDEAERWLAHYPERLFAALHAVSTELRTPIFMTGGAVRDWLLGKVPMDLDFSIVRDAAAFTRALQRSLRGGTLVELGRPEDDTCRLVKGDLSIDVTGFRNGAGNIEADLEQRDFTINALGIAIEELLGGEGAVVGIIDPLDGLQDKASRLIRACPDAFVDDPLRMLRAFRFFAQLGYSIEPETRGEIVRCAAMIERSAAERVSYECNCIMASDRAFETMDEMARAGLLEKIAPELWLGDGVEQPAFHHLDVLRHNLRTLDCIEQVIERPTHYFPGCAGPLEIYLENKDNRVLLKWAALFHDVGKPVVQDSASQKHDRITFHNHDGEGARLFQEFASRQKWSKRSRQRVAALITMHMHPFHLLSTRSRDGELSRKARLRICRRAGSELPGLFLLAMADCLAGQGVEKPVGLEEELAGLYCELASLYQEALEPLLAGPKLLTGADLIATLGLSPGPLFRLILEEVETARLEGDIGNREEALEWARHYLDTQV
jgi:poly(A) polymerase